MGHENARDLRASRVHQEEGSFYCHPGHRCIADKHGLDFVPLAGLRTRIFFLEAISCSKAESVSIEFAPSFGFPGRCFIGGPRNFRLSSPTFLRVSGLNSFPAILALSLNLAVPSIVIGFLIGFGGIGGVLLAPALSVIGGLPIQQAIRICMWVYVVSGVVGTAMFLRNNYIRGRMLLALTAGVCPSALAGAFALNWIGAPHLEILMAVVIFTSGLFTLNRLHFVGSGQASLNETGLVAIGLVTGFGSSLTGTGGALILIP